jgi:hypothetical protein
MEIKDVKRLKKSLEKSILNIVTEFEAVTDMRINEISYSRGMIVGCDSFGYQEVGRDVTVSVELT